MSDIEFSENMPVAPARLFFIGIGGIGMSGLAQFLAARGYQVAGSDRGLDDASKRELYDALRVQNIQLYPQDGSGVKTFQPDAFVISAAIESGNADLAAAPKLPIIHRATALANALAALHCHRISVAGSCGKTSVTAWIASALKALGHSIVMVNGGYVNDFKSTVLPGNFYMDENPEFAIAEVDESDKSIREFSQETAVLLNIGNDHYGKDELAEVFTNYLNRTTGTCVVAADIAPLISCKSKLTTFSMPDDYRANPRGILFVDKQFGAASCRQSGRHSALNAAAVMQAVAAACPSASPAAIVKSIADFNGVLQRFEVVSQKSGFPAVVNDYAHNPEKLSAAIGTAHERFGAPVCAIFQPHGFGPLKFMREALLEMLGRELLPEDKFILLPVFYAGGTTSFSPTSEEVAEEAAARGLPVISVASREDALAAVPKSTKAILVLGARDPSLRTWSMTI